MELIDSCLLEVRVAFYLIKYRSDLTSCEKIKKHGNGAVAHTNTLGQALLDKFLHIFPDDMMWWR